CNVHVANPDGGNANKAGGWTYNAVAPTLQSASLTVGTKNIITFWSQPVTCPDATAFSFNDAYTGPSSAGAGAQPGTAVSSSGNNQCTVTFAGFAANFSTNDYGTLTYTEPASPTTSNAVY